MVTHFQNFKKYNLIYILDLCWLLYCMISLCRFPTDNDLLRERSERYIDDVEWMRPSDIVRPEDPVLVSDRNEGFDIRTRYNNIN